MYGSIKVVYRDDTVRTYDTYIGHLVRYERDFGAFTESITAAARVGWVVSDSPLPFDEWVAGVKYVEPITDQTPLAEDEQEGAATEPVPTP